MKIKTYNIIIGIIVVVLMIGGISISIKTWTLGGNESDYHVVCIGGHEYYRANFLQKMGIAPKLDDDGKPVRCY